MTETDVKGKRKKNLLKEKKKKYLWLFATRDVLDDSNL